MRKSLLTLLFFNLFIVALSAQIKIKGNIYFNNKPKSNVTVYLNNTTTGSVTNEDGSFYLEAKSGVYQLIISHLGFKTITYDFDTSTYSKPLVFSLIEQESILDEVVVSKKLNNKQWNYNFSVFIREFIGTSAFSKSCVIENPEVLHFEFDSKSNTLTAEATALLRIKNKALGYEILYDLKHFCVEKKTVKYLGYSYFKELKGSKKKKKRWLKNRQIAYHGSPIHFYKSLLNNTLKEEGFIIDLFIRNKNKARPSQEELVKARNTLSESKTEIHFSRKINTPENAIDSALVVLKKAKLPKYIDYLYSSKTACLNCIDKENNQTYLEFENNLKVTYLKEKEEKGYILRNLFSKPRKATTQTSNIIVFAKKIMIHPNGILANPLDVLYEAYWSYEKFAHCLPIDYTPINKD